MEFFPTRAKWVTLVFVVGFLVDDGCGALWKRLQIDLVVPGVASFAILGTLNSTGPAFDTGLEVLRTTYPQQEWRLTFLPTPSCPEEVITVQTRLAEWYYTVHRQNSLCVIITPGKCSIETVTCIFCVVDFYRTIIPDINIKIEFFHYVLFMISLRFCWILVLINYQDDIFIEYFTIHCEGVISYCF